MGNRSCFHVVYTTISNYLKKVRSLAICDKRNNTSNTYADEPTAQSDNMENLGGHGWPPAGSKYCGVKERGGKMISKSALIREVTKFEGGKKNTDIAQVSEIVKIVLQLLSEEKPSDVLKLLENQD